MSRFGNLEFGRHQGEQKDHVETLTDEAVQLRDAAEIHAGRDDAADLVAGIAVTEGAGLCGAVAHEQSAVSPLHRLHAARIPGPQSEPLGPLLTCRHTQPETSSYL